MAHDPNQFVQETVLNGSVVDFSVSAGQADDGPGVNYGVPSRYVGPSVGTQPALVNPSAGEGAPGVSPNPQGSTPPKNNAPAERGNEPYPNTTVDL